MAIAAGEIVFADTNVLLAATDRSREYHQESRRIFLDASRVGYHVALSGQILREYLVVATRPVAENGLGLPVADALHNVEVFARRPTVFCDEPESVHERLRQLVRAHPVKGKRVHDANVVATMLTHGIRRVITHNPSDFEPFDEIETVTASAAPPAGPERADEG